MTRVRYMLMAGLLGVGLSLIAAAPARAQQVDPALNRFFYYPYYYFPANYWPTQGPQWPEPPGAPTSGRRPTWPTRRSTSRTGATNTSRRNATTAASISGSTSSEPFHGERPA